MTPAERLRAAVHTILVGDALPKVGTADHAALLTAARIAVSEVRQADPPLPPMLVAGQLQMLRLVLDALAASMAVDRAARLSRGGADDDREGS